MINNDIGSLMKKAKLSLAAAKELLNAGYPEFSVSRSYYAMFYVSQALLLTKNEAFSKHSAVISAFGKEFVKSGLLPAEMHKNILEAFDIRQIGDYGAVGAVSKKEASELIAHAEAFIKAAEKYLKDKEKGEA